MKKLILIILIVVVNSLNAQNIFRDDFSTYTTNQQLSGQGVWTNNSSAAGGLGSCTGATCVNAKVIPTAISYNNYGSSANSIELKNNLDGCGRSFTAFNGGTMYFSMVINISQAYTINLATDFFRIMAGSNSAVPFRLTAMSITPGFFSIGVSKGSGPVFYYSQQLAMNTNHLIVCKYITNPGATNDIVAMYVNPSIQLGEPATADAGFSTGTDVVGNIDRMCFRQNVALGVPVGRAGLISVSGTWLGLRFPALGTIQYENNEITINASQLKNGFLNISSNRALENNLLQIFDIRGQLLENKTISLKSNDNLIVTKTILMSGIYILKLTNNEGLNMFKKVLVQ
jgi:hypothetical protein